MSRNCPKKAFASKKKQNFSTNRIGGNTASEDESTSPTEFIIHEITIIGNRPSATGTSSKTIDTVDQRMLLMDKGNGLNAIMEKLQVSTAEQTFPEVTSEDENSTARSSKSSSRFIENPFDSGNGKAEEIGGCATAMIQSSIDEVTKRESDIENEKSDWKIEGNCIDDTMQKSIVNKIEIEIEIEIEKQLNEKSPTDEFYKRQFSIADIQNDSGKFKEENERATPTNTPIHENGFEKSTTTVQYDDVERPDALMDFILNSLLDDCAEIEKSENDVAYDEAVNSQSKHECLKLALQSILEDEENCVDAVEIPMPESCSTDQSSTERGIGSGMKQCLKLVAQSPPTNQLNNSLFNSADEYEDSGFNNSIRSISSELISDCILVSKLVNGCSEIEQQPFKINAVVATGESSVSKTMEDSQLEQASADLVIESILRDENICKDDVKAPLLSNITTKPQPQPQQQEDAKSIMDDRTDTSKSTEIEIATEILLVEQTIAKEIDSAIANAVKSVEIEEKTSSANVSINGLKDEPIDACTDNAVIDESFADVLPCADADTMFTLTECAHTTPMKISECEQQEEHIHAVVHEIMGSVDKLFECVF